MARVTPDLGYSQALAAILASERLMARQIARAHAPLIRSLQADVRRGIRPAMTRVQGWALQAAMRSAILGGAERGWALGWAFRDRQIGRKRGAARFAVDEAPGIPDGYRVQYERTVDDALRRYEDDARRRISDLTQKAALEGWTNQRLTQEIRPMVDGMRTWKAERIARTETMRMWNVGAYARMEAEDEDLIGYEYTVVMDDRTSHTCRLLDGLRVRREDVKRVPPLHPHCVLPGQLVETPGGVIAGLRAWYDGLAVELTLSNGARLSVTGNHLILTPNGFAAAQHLREGDDVVCACGLDRILPADPHVDDGVALIEDVFGSLCVSAGMATVSVPTTPEDLHGDGELIDGQIDVVGPHSLLGDAHQTAIGEHGVQEHLGSADIARAALSSDGGIAEALKALAATADGIMGGRRECAAFLGRGVRHPALHGVRPGPEGDTGTPEARHDRRFRHPVARTDGNRGFPGVVGGDDVLGRQDSSTGPALIDHAPHSLDASRNSRAIEPYLLADLLQSHARHVELCHVVRVNVFAYRGHVYDLQTLASVYLCNVVAVSNCRTVMSPVYSFDEGAESIRWASGDRIAGAPGFGEVPDVGGVGALPQVNVASLPTSALPDAPAPVSLTAQLHATPDADRQAFVATHMGALSKEFDQDVQAGRDPDAILFDHELFGADEVAKRYTAFGRAHIPPIAQHWSEWQAQIDSATTAFDVAMTAYKSVRDSVERSSFARYMSGIEDEAAVLDEARRLDLVLGPVRKAKDALDKVKLDAESAQYSLVRTLLAGRHGKAGAIPASVKVVRSSAVQKSQITRGMIDFMGIVPERFRTTVDNELKQVYHTKARAYHTSLGVIRVPASDKSTLFHEMMHSVETDPGEVAISRAYLLFRAAGARATVIYRGSKEYGFRDAFSNHYTGKDYGPRATEIMSMGIEGLAFGKHKMLTDDIDTAAHVLGRLLRRG